MEFPLWRGVGEDECPFCRGESWENDAVEAAAAVAAVAVAPATAHHRAVVAVPASEDAAAAEQRPVSRQRPYRNL